MKRNGFRKRVGNSILRMVLVGICLTAQVGWLLLLILRLNAHWAWISALTGLLALLLVLQLYSRPGTPSMKMPWIMLTLVFPVMGVSLYLLTAVFEDPDRTGKRLAACRERFHGGLHQDPETLSLLERQDPGVANICGYLRNFGAAPVYRDTRVTYYGQAAQAFEDLKRELEQAKSFIFLEYFIVSDGSCFRELAQILIRKASQGVEVRLMYDDIGSIGYVDLRFDRELNDAGVRCLVFNPAKPVLNLFMNHRDHRKIAVIDGKVAFTGGYNLSDEYFGRTFPYGLWKDTGIRLEGQAVESLTAAYLEMWCAMSRQQDPEGSYLSVRHSMPVSRGFVQPYFDDPLGRERLGENVYRNLAARARKRLYIATPYLIITDEMRSALCLAAKRGVDVRIVTPGIPDKRTVYGVTRSYYGGLAAEGVRIYEWSPGFLHAKQCLCDADLATIGTSNLDYRSLYHHFENNVLLYDCDAVEEIARDFEDLFVQSREVTERYRTGPGAFLRIWQCVLRLFAPLM